MIGDSVWPPGSPRVLLTDAWLANAGDAAIALGLDRLVRAVAPTAAIVHACYQHAEVGPLLRDLRVVPPLEGLLGTPWAPPAPGWEDTGRSLVAGADVVICQGGGFLVEAYQPIARLAALAEVVRSGIRLALVGITIEGFRRAAHRRLLLEVLSGAELVSVRDPRSLVHAADLGAADVALGADLALALFPDRPGTDRRAPCDSAVSVVLTDHHPVAARRPDRLATAGSVLRAVVDHADPSPLLVWSTVQGLSESANEDDHQVASSLVSSLDPAERRSIEVASGFVTPQRAIDLVSSSRALVTMRLHAALFAAATGTPFALVLGGQRRGVLAGTDLVDRIVDPGDAAAITRAVAVALDEPSPAPALWDALAPLRHRLDQTQELLGRFIDEG